MSANKKPFGGILVILSGDCCKAHWVGLLDFFWSGIQFYVHLSLYLYFISFLYLDLYVLGDDAWIS